MPRSLKSSVRFGTVSGTTKIELVRKQRQRFNSQKSNRNSLKANTYTITMIATINNDHFAISPSSTHSTERLTGSMKTLRSEGQCGNPKGVRFNEKVRVRATITRRQYSEEEKAACYLSTEESKDIRVRCHALAMRAQEDGAPKLCVRGLEAFFGNIGMQKIAMRQMQAWAVFDVQDSDPHHSAEDVAEACREVSEVSGKVALALAERDAKEASKCLKSTWSK